ncbi:MAG TPA: hypothetical protein VHV29_06820 [Terriglobales bacterium]|jgi:hypothetical protein|nr:hypothetical protein [Terriglobales bacterium]
MDSEPNGYFLLDGSFISVPELSNADRDIQIEAMRAWFLMNFEHPAEHTPYDEGYIYIWGGPYHPSTELNTEFENIVPSDVIEELVKQLQKISSEWAPANPDISDEDAAFLGIGSDHLGVFRSGLLDILSVLGNQMEAPTRKIINRLLYANVVTVLECFLSDFFTSHVKNDPALLRKFFEESGSFKERKFPLSDIYKTMGAIDKIAHSELSILVWHRLKAVRRLYQTVLSVSFPTDTTQLEDVIKLRHELVHRNGKKEDGTIHDISEAQIRGAAMLAEEFVDHIEKGWTARKKPHN